MCKFKIVSKKALIEREQQFHDLTVKYEKLKKELARKTPQRDEKGRFISKNA